MAMTKKGRRKIVVNDIVYFWKVLPNNDGVYLIEDGENSDYQIKGVVCIDEIKTISPSIISQIIILASENGWRPGYSKEKKYVFKDYHLLKTRCKSYWRPEIYKGKQSLKKGESNVFFFNKSDKLYFSWGEYNHSTNLRASCTIDSISHHEFGEIWSVESEGENFKVISEHGEHCFGVNDFEFWNLEVELNDFLVLPKLRI